ncbi:MAG: YlmH/Sll1252 family protein [Caloramator sp.]|nr:YlmH/Sll1252 family protein [Caloramator sp.]
MNQINVKDYIIDKNIYLSFLNKIDQAKKWQTVFTDFLNPEEQAALKELCFDEGVKAVFFNEEKLERTIAKLGLDEDIDFPIDVLKIEGNFKFEQLEHRDYLGAVLSLGIKREKIGDINVFDDGAEVYVLKELSDYIVMNLTQIKHTGVKVKKIPLEEAREKQLKFKELNINIASLRLDAVVAELIGVSRNRASELIRNEKVKLNFKITKEVDKKVEQNSLLSIKGYGRYQLGECLGTTRNGRFIFSAKKII